MEINTGQATAEAANITVAELGEVAIEIVELQANAGVTPLDHDNLISETFSDADGFNDLVNTGNTNATFDTNKYKRVAVTTETLAALTTTDTPFTTKQMGIKLYADSSFSIYSVTKGSLNTTTKCYIKETDGTIIGTATFSGDIATFASPIALTSGEYYYIVTDSEGGSYQAHYAGGVSFPLNKTYGDVTESGYYLGGSWTNEGIGVLRSISAYSVAAGGSSNKVIEIDLPTIDGDVVASELILNCPDRESGDDIKYNLIDTDTSEDEDLEIETKNYLANCDGQKITGGKLQIILYAATTTPTDAVPSVKSLCLKLWKV